MRRVRLLVRLENMAQHLVLRQKGLQGQKVVSVDDHAILALSRFNASLPTTEMSETGKRAIPDIVLHLSYRQKYLLYFLQEALCHR